MRGLASFLLACACWCFISTLAIAAERSVARHQGLTASVDSGFGCARSASITVRAPEASAYTGDRIALQRLLGAARAGLGANCPILNEIDITGFADGDPAFRATITADDGWRLPTGIGRIRAENPLSPLARETARCDYERSDPFVGCWIGLSPERGRDMILNIRNDGTWYWDTPEKLALGEPVFDGKEIVYNNMYFVGQLLTFVQKKGGFFDMVGPYFAEECNILKLNPYQLGGTQESQIFVRLHSPQWINANILNPDDIDSNDGYTGNAGNDEIIESLPDDGNLFNDCIDNFDQEPTEKSLLELAVVVLPLLRVATITTGQLFSRLIPIIKESPKYIALLRTSTVGWPIGMSFGKYGITTTIPKLSLSNLFKIDKGTHFVERMVERGIGKAGITATVTRPLVVLRQAGGRKYLFISENAAVVVDSEGWGVTVYGRNDFSEDIINIIKLFKNN